ncbi:MAG: hypothetical protein ABJD68_15265, partial [Nakamurella sp.]
MGDFDGGRRRWRVAAVALAAVILALTGGVWLGHAWTGYGSTAAAAVAVPSATSAVSGAPMTPPWPATARTAGAAHLSG